MSDYLGKDIFKLGFGLMRLPKLQDGSIDIEQVKVMTDKFIEAGGVYFDWLTANMTAASSFTAPRCAS